MKLPDRIGERFRAYGRAGGSDFESLGLPGGDMIDAGLAALAAGEETVESLLVSIAAARLAREGVPVPREVISDADARLYSRLESADPGTAHARYNAYRRQAVSFANACARARKR